MSGTLSFVVSVLALLLSVSSWVYTLASQKKKVELSVYGYMYNERSRLFYMSFQNKSRLPIAITGITLLEEKQSINCVNIPVKVLEITSRTGNEVTSRDRYFSERIPINLPSLGAVSGYVYFDNAPQTILTDTTEATFEVHTNRGSLGKMTLQWNAGDQILRNRKQ